MRQIPMLTTVAQNQRMWELEFSDPHVVWFAPPLSTLKIRAAFFTVYLFANFTAGVLAGVQYFQLHCILLKISCKFFFAANSVYNLKSVICHMCILILLTPFSSLAIF